MPTFASGAIQMQTLLQSMCLTACNANLPLISNIGLFISPAPCRLATALSSVSPSTAGLMQTLAPPYAARIRTQQAAVLVLQAMRSRADSGWMCGRRWRKLRGSILRLA